MKYDGQFSNKKSFYTNVGLVQNIWKEVCMGLAAINNQYLNLNGICGGYGMGYAGAGLYSESYTDNAKQCIENGYELSAVTNSYANKASVSSSSFAQQCQAIEFLLNQGRTDDAMAKYNDLYKDMASNSYYEGYNENEIKTLMQDKYLTATGTTIVNDIANNSSSSFAAGAKSSIPIVGALNSNNSSDDFVAEATGTKKSGWSTVKKGAGVVAGVGASAGAVYGITKLAGMGASSSSMLNTISKSSKTAAIATAVLAIGTFIAGKIIKSNKD